MLALWQEGLQVASKHGYILQLASLYMEIGRRLTAQGKRVRFHNTQSAKQVFARLELKQDLTQVERYLSQIDAVRHPTSPRT